MPQQENPITGQPALLHFVHFPRFTARWAELRLSDDMLRLLQFTILLAPTRAPVIQGTGGLRKLRFARPGAGKSGGCRIGNAYFPAFGVVALVAVFTKNEKDNFSAAEKPAITQAMQRFENWLQTLTQRAKP